MKATYYCPACKRQIKREVARVTKTHKSFCERTGKDVVMRLVK